MKLIRLVVSIVVAVFLGALYAASQWACFHGAPAASEFAKKADSPSVRALSALLLALAVVLAFFRDPEPDGGGS